MIEIGKYYVIKSNNYYFCTNVQSRIQFQETQSTLPLVIKIEHSDCDDRVFFGKLIKHSPFGDELTDVELEVGQIDILCEYNFQKYEMPFFYMDFPNVGL